MSVPVKLEASVPSDVRLLGYISKLVQDTIKLMMEDQAKADKLCASVDVCLTEALTNAIQHAHGSDASRPLNVSVVCDDGLLTMRIYDTGPGFNISDVPEPAFDELKEHGRGIYIMKNSMDNVVYKPVPGGNMLEMSKRLA